MDSQRKHTGQRGPALGIDLGATATLAAIYVPGQPEPMLVRPHPDLPEYHDPWLPSLVCLTDSEPLVGEHARRYIRNPRGRDRALLIRCAKREMAFANRLYRLGNQSHSPIDISAILLRHMRQAAASQLGCSVDALREAVITVPAYFGQGERKNTRTAGEKAGFQQVHLLDEPLAATIGLRINETEGDNLVLVVHLGGATFDVTLLRAGQAVPHGGIYEVSRDGDGFLGGIDWDRAIAMFALTHTDRPWDWERRVCDPRLGFLDPSNILLFEPCEHVKRQFCAANPPSSIRFQFTDLVDMQSYQVTMTHAEFLQHTRELRQRCIDVCSRLLREVPDQELRGLRRPPANLLERLWPRRVKQLEWGDIRRICFVGGSSRIHSLRHDIRNCWPRASREPELDERPELQAVFGAAYCAARPELVKQLEQMGLRCPHTLGVWHYPAPRRSLWERLWGRPLGSSVQRNREQDLESRKKFWPLILKNQRIPAAPRVRATVTGRCSKFLAVLVEQRIDPRDPNGVEYRELGELIVACERPAPERQACAVDVELKYHSDRDLTF
jgi:molecular chaperone DnaK (HSP70)